MAWRIVGRIDGGRQEKGPDPFIPFISDVEGWQPSVIDGSTDSRTLGVAVRRVKLWQAGTPEPQDAPAPRITTAVDRALIAQQCVKPVGQGAGVRLPAVEPVQLADLFAAILSNPADCGLAQVPPLMLPTAKDGIWSAILPNRILLHNSADEPRRLTIELQPGTLRRLGAAVPEAGQVKVLLPPHSLGSVELPSGRVVVP